MKTIKKYKESLSLLFIALISLFFSPLSSTRFLSFSFKSLSYIFLFILIEEGIKKENLLLPLFRLLNSIRTTGFLTFVLVLSTFVLSFFIYPIILLSLIIPFVVRLIRVSNKEKYKNRILSLILLSSLTSSLISPFSNMANYIEYTENSTSIFHTLLIPFLLSFLILIVETVLVINKMKGDEIYLHIEDEEYWDNERRGIRIFYLAFFVVLFFATRFNAIDLFLVVLVSLLLFDRKLFKSLSYNLIFSTLFLFIIRDSIINTALMSNSPRFVMSLLALIMGRILTISFSPEIGLGALFLLSYPLCYITSNLEKEERKGFFKTYYSLSLPFSLCLFFLIYFM